MENELLPAIDTTQYRTAMQNGHKSGEAEAPDKYTPDQGVELVHASDEELMEDIHPIYTVRDWMGTSYQKKENGKWRKLGSTKQLKVHRKKKSEEQSK